MLYKFFWTRTKNRVIENRVMENRVKRGITVVYKYAVTSVLNSESLDLYLGTMIYEKETCSSPSQ